MLHDILKARLYDLCFCKSAFTAFRACDCSAQGVFQRRAVTQSNADVFKHPHIILCFSLIFFFFLHVFTDAVYSEADRQTDWCRRTHSATHTITHTNTRTCTHHLQTGCDLFPPSLGGPRSSLIRLTLFLCFSSLPPQVGLVWMRPIRLMHCTYTPR